MIIPNFKIIVTTESRKFRFHFFVVNGELIVKDGSLNGRSLGLTHSYAISLLSAMKYIDKKLPIRTYVKSTYDSYFYNGLVYKKANNTQVKKT